MIYSLVSRVCMQADHFSLFITKNSLIQRKLNYQKPFELYEGRISVKNWNKLLEVVVSVWSDAGGETGDDKL